VPPAPEDYIHRVGRTARAEAVGDALTLVSPAEEGDLRSIERAVGTRIPRVTLASFDYTARTAERLEIPKGTVMSRLFHARKKMQAALREYAGLAGRDGGDEDAP